MSWRAETRTLDELCDIARGGSPRPIKAFLTNAPDGINWTNRLTSDTSDLKDALWLGTEFIVVGSGGTILYTPDGITWTDESFQFTRYDGVATNGTDTIIVGDKGTIVKSLP